MLDTQLHNIVVEFSNDKILFRQYDKSSNIAGSVDLKYGFWKDVDYLGSVAFFFSEVRLTAAETHAYDRAVEILFLLFGAFVEIDQHYPVFPLHFHQHH